ncbi:MAG: DUF6174 domain-containing protein [Dehalococcoidales bacterium]|nr:DUF6174 domain-containing protein [Dehalococcoidales bacterium]
MRSKIILFFSLIAMVIVAGMACSPDIYDQLQDTLRGNQQRWTSRNISSYRYRIQIGCFCPQDITHPVIIEVRNNQPASITYADTGAAVTTDFFGRCDTMTKLFSIIENAITQEVDELTVSYEAEFGYPTNIYIDASQQAADEEISYTVSGFEIIP